MAVSTAMVGACVVRVDSEGYRAVEQRTFEVESDRSNVLLVTFDGSIEVRSWDRREISVEIVKRGSSKEFVDAIVILAESTDGNTTVEVRRPAELGSLLGLESDGSAAIVASIPARSNLVARSGDGSISVERVSGRIELRTEDGRIQGIDLSGDVVASTGNGRIRLDSVDGTVELSSGDGRVTGLQIETGDGSIRVTVAPGSRVETDWDVWTGDGGIVVTLPPDLDADIDAQTASGRVRVQDDMVSVTESRDRRHLRGRLGDGGRPIRIRTADGSIRLRVR